MVPFLNDESVRIATYHGKRNMQKRLASGTGYAPVNPTEKCSTLLSWHNIDAKFLPIHDNIVRFFEQAEHGISNDMDDETIACLLREVTLINRNVPKTSKETKRFITRNKKRLRENIERIKPSESKSEEPTRGATLRISAPTKFVDLI